jgi:predicted Zn-dependent protease
MCVRDALCECSVLCLARSSYTGRLWFQRNLHVQEKSLESRVGSSMPQFLRTHPLTDDRVKRVQDQLAEVRISCV